LFRELGQKFLGGTDESYQTLPDRKEDEVA
jgi:hypothetical protein